MPNAALGRVVRSAIAHSEQCAEHIDRAVAELIAVAEDVEQIVEWCQAGAQVREMAEAIAQLKVNIAGMATKMGESLAESEARFTHGQWRN